MVFQSSSSFPWLTLAQSITRDLEGAVFLADRIALFSPRPAGIGADVDVASLPGPERTLELRDSAAFFRLRMQVPHSVRASAGVQE